MTSTDFQVSDLINSTLRASLNSTMSTTVVSHIHHIPFLSRWWLRRVIITPEWHETHRELSWVWLLHVYGFSCLFFLLAFYTFFSILNFRAQLSSRPFMATINVFLCILGSSRSVFFLIDPYNFKKILPDAISAILWELAYPCLASAFSLVQLAFFLLTQLRFGPNRLRSKSCLSLVISIHFCLVIAINILWSFRGDLKLLNLGLHSIACCWALFMCVSFLFGGWRAMKLLKLLPPVLFPRSDSGNSCLLQLNLLAKCNNLATVANTVAGPTIVTPPKIRITDENEYSYSYISDTSHTDANVTESRTNDWGEPGTKNSRLEEVTSDVCTPRSILPPHSSVRFSSSPPTCLHNGSVVKETTTVSSNITRADDDFSDSSLLEEMSRGAEKQRSTDFNISSVLNHIAFVDSAMDDIKFDARRVRPTKRSQIEKLLRATCLSALLGVVVTCCHLYNTVGPYGLCASDQPPSPWPWFTFHTIFRLSEFSMGCVMANITKQQVNQHHFPYSSQLQQLDNFD